MVIDYKKLFVAHICVLGVMLPATVHTSTFRQKRPMNNNDIKRISRLTAILTKLQTKRLLTASELADKFSVSIRTIYRDIKALEQAGIPILTEDGKGYTLMDGYRIPPVMFTEAQANALITAEQLVLKNKDTSFIKEYTEAIDKIKAVLNYSVKDKSNLLSERVHFRQNNKDEKTSNYLSDLQFALTNFRLAEIKYANENQKNTNNINNSTFLFQLFCIKTQIFIYQIQVHSKRF